MSIFGDIVSKIFHAATAITTSIPQANAASAVPGPAGGAVQPGAGSSQLASQGTQAQMPQGQAPVQMPQTAPLQEVDVEQVLDGLCAKSGQKLNWQQSIVDMMKLLDMDSSLTARKQLAHEFGYTGDTEDSATMNVWLHKQVMQKLEENGGHLPANLKAA